MSVPFSPDQFERADRPIRSMPVRRVRSDRLRSTQVYLDEHKVNSMRRAGGVPSKIPLVVKHDGLYFIQDGHHRAAADASSGYVRVRVVN